MGAIRRTAPLMVVAAILVLALTGSAGAKNRAATKVTIKAPGGDVYGYVKSERRKCMAGRKVVVFRVVGEQGGGDDDRIGSDTAEANGDRYMWSIGQPGVSGEEIYAKARKTDRCKRGISKVIVAG